MAAVKALLQCAGELQGESARRDVEVLLCHCLQRPRSWLYAWPEAELEPSQERHFASLLARRRAGEPVAYILGKRDFWGLCLEVSPQTLIPRPDTETLVEWALAVPLPARARVLDLGTGSGALALALAVERPQWQVTATDASAGALEVASRNASRHCPGRVRLLRSDWFSALAGERYDLIVSNPPYIEARDSHLQSGDLRFEPRSALAAGPDGLSDLRRIIAGAPGHLRRGACLLLEHGYRQGSEVRELLLAAGFAGVATRRDLAGHERASGGRRDAQ